MTSFIHVNNMLHISLWRCLSCAPKTLLPESQSATEKQWRTRLHACTRLEDQLKICFKTIVITNKDQTSAKPRATQNDAVAWNENPTEINSNVKWNCHELTHFAHRVEWDCTNPFKTTIFTAIADTNCEFYWANFFCIEWNWSVMK